MLSKKFNEIKNKHVLIYIKREMKCQIFPLIRYKKNFIFFSDDVFIDEK